MDLVGAAPEKEGDRDLHGRDQRGPVHGLRGIAEWAGLCAAGGGNPSAAADGEHPLVVVILGGSHPVWPGRDSPCDPDWS